MSLQENARQKNSVLSTKQVKESNMILISCVDKHMGIMFNGRRQSRDSVLNERIVQISSKTKLWMNYYSETLFKKMTYLTLIFRTTF